MKFVLVVILVLLPSLGFTQEGTEATQPEAQHADTDDEKALHELEATQAQRKKALESLSKVGEGPAKGPTLDPKEQLDKMGFDGALNPTALFNAEALDAMDKVVKEAKMWELPEAQVREQVLNAFKGNPLEGLVKGSPAVQSFIVDFMRDKTALSSCIAIFKDRPRLKIYLYFWIGIMFAAYYLKRLFISKFWKRPVKILASLAFALTVSVITLSTFGIIFQEELRPIVALVKKRF